MAKLKNENVKQCVSILKGFIDGSAAVDKNKAVLALEQLKRVTAGIDIGGPICISKPLANGSIKYSACLSKPRADIG